MNLCIRAMIADEVIKVWDLFQDLSLAQDNTQYLTGSFEKFKEELTRNDPRNTVIVAVSDEEIVGMISFCRIFSFYRANDYAFMRLFYVKKSFQKQGIGRALMKFVAKVALQEGLHGMQWDVYEKNSKARGFFNNLLLNLDPEDLVHYWATKNDLQRLAG